MTKRVYISGPMTGYKDLNYPAFNIAAETLRGFGFEVENPAENDYTPDTPWHICMRGALARMVTCDMAVFLPGFVQSRGAKLEWDVCKAVGIRCLGMEQIIKRYGHDRT